MGRPRKDDAEVKKLKIKEHEVLKHERDIASCIASIADAVRALREDMDEMNEAIIELKDISKRNLASCEKALTDGSGENEKFLRKMLEYVMEIKGGKG